MRRDPGWYSVRELGQDGEPCESNEWVPAKCGSSGKWLVPGWDRFRNLDELKEYFEVSDYRINPVPADESERKYAVRFHYPNGQKIISSNQARKLSDLIDIAEFCKTRNPHLIDADVVEVTTETRVVKEGD